MPGAVSGTGHPAVSKRQKSLPSQSRRCSGRLLTLRLKADYCLVLDCSRESVPSPLMIPSCCANLVGVWGGRTCWFTVAFAGQHGARKERKWKPSPYIDSFDFAMWSRSIQSWDGGVLNGTLLLKLEPGAQVGVLLPTLCAVLPSILVQFSAFPFPLGPNGHSGTDVSSSEPNPGSCHQSTFPALIEALPAGTPRSLYAVLAWASFPSSLPPNASALQGALVVAAALSFSRCLEILMWFYPGTAPVAASPVSGLEPLIFLWSGCMSPVADGRHCLLPITWCFWTSSLSDDACLLWPNTQSSDPVFSSHPDSKLAICSLIFVLFTCLPLYFLLVSYFDIVAASFGLPITQIHQLLTFFPNYFVVCFLSLLPSPLLSSLSSFSSPPSVPPQLPSNLPNPLPHTYFFSEPPESDLWTSYPCIYKFLSLYFLKTYQT